MKDILIINTGGTFNKVYDETKGELVIPKSSKNLKKLIQKAYKNKIKVKGIIYKDSLDFTKKDREHLLQTIKESKQKKIVVIHGTDTMNKSAKYLANKMKDKQIVFVGAMQPFSIDPVESTGALMMAIGFLHNRKKTGVYICMNGLIKKHTKIKKNYKKGVFECH